MVAHAQGRIVFVSDETPTKEELKVLHTAIKKVSADIEVLSLNTSIPAFMVCVNELKRLECTKRSIMEALTVLIAPFAPFIAEELWHRLGKTGSVHQSPFPVCDESYLVEDNVAYPICINGKRKGELTFPAASSADELQAMALANEMVQKWLDGQTPKKSIVVPGRMINFVI
ncbi:MAG: class I tRNA ligase family protein [Saprospiraceae bacterium]|nr:class I tRNA ligase family protein [Saprospiraceae bacterium]